jgi:hypothetical protein
LSQVAGSTVESGAGSTVESGGRQYSLVRWLHIQRNPGVSPPRH